MDEFTFTHPGIKQRKPRQRYAPRVLPPFCFERDGLLLVSDAADPIGTVRVVGEFQGTSPFGGAYTYEALEVTLTDGTGVACYRIKSAADNFAVCQWERYTLGIAP